MHYDEYKNINVLVGQTLSKVEQTTYGGDDCLRFETTDGKLYLMMHQQDCCESVYLDDIAGDLQDLVGSPITQAEEVDNEPPVAEPEEYPPESETWTFYKLATVKGYVTLRWYGTSNGYYSERADFMEVEQ